MIVLKNNKLLVILLFAFILKGYSQTYNVKIDYDASADGCHAAGYSWIFKGNTTTITSFSDGGNTMEVNDSQTFTNIPVSYSSFSLSLHSSCVPLGGATTSCNDNVNATKTAVQMIQGAYLGLGGCNGGVNISSFKPNITIQNLDSTDPSNICAGFSLSLAGFPANFPAEAYHWQYSLNNTTWIDVPATIAGRVTNNTPTPTFSMQELLGANHTTYINKPIYFRLGYTTTAFTNPLVLNYSACSPLVTGIEYQAPNCNGDAIPKVTVSFDRPLSSDEVLTYIYIKDKNNGAISNQRTDVVFDVTEPQKYIFYNISPLEDTRTYEIGYQAKKGSILRGSMFSTQSFTYNDPKKLQFKVTGQTLPTCFGSEDATIDIEILSGELPYNFYVDDILKTTSKIDDLHYKITGLKANAVGYKIKVTDKNNCIEK